MAAQDYSRAIWRKSTRSNNQGNCVEVAVLDVDAVAVRDSKDPHGAVLGFSRAGWLAFMAGARGGELDLS